MLEVHEHAEVPEVLRSRFALVMRLQSPLQAIRVELLQGLQGLLSSVAVLLFVDLALVDDPNGVGQFHLVADHEPAAAGGSFRRSGVPSQALAAGGVPAEAPAVSRWVAFVFSVVNHQDFLLQLLGLGEHVRHQQRFQLHGVVGALATFALALALVDLPLHDLLVDGPAESVDVLCPVVLSVQLWSRLAACDENRSASGPFLILLVICDDT
mmetsp:Transcript_4015/g.9527  ORF Transcript_4015/g.9527 Transcript_4015/m.9527 type:complete len:211 (-) Transcript_4015:916-1548(-)